MLRLPLLVFLLAFLGCAAGETSPHAGAAEPGESVGQEEDAPRPDTEDTLAPPETEAALDAPDDDQEFEGPSVPVSVTPGTDFGPVPGGDPAQLEAWTALLEERFFGSPTPERQAALDEVIASADVVDMTPAYVNLVGNRDMADPDDVARVAELTHSWWERQGRYKQVVVDPDLEDMDQVTVGNRLLALESWVRWWKRTTERSGSLDRYRARVAEILELLERTRAERRQG